VPRDDVDRELANHIDLEAEELMDRGMPADEARRRAHLTLGNGTVIKEAIYDSRRGHVFDPAVRDAVMSVRSMRRHPNYAAALVLIIGICLGANMAIFSVVYSVLLRPLPVPDSDRIVLMANRSPKATTNAGGGSSPADYYDRLRGVAALQDQAMFQLASQVLETGQSGERIRGMLATPSLFALLGVAPQLGRTFIDAEGEPGANHVMILSHELWQRVFAADPNVLGREIRMGGRPFVIVGVMPPQFSFVDPEVRFWEALVFSPEQRQQRHHNGWMNVGRLRPGATMAHAQSQVDAVNAANLETAGGARSFLMDSGFRTHVEPLKEFLTRDARASLQWVWGGALLVLATGTLNVASMVAARTSARRREMGTRMALGASPRRLASQSFVEHLVLCLAGGALGLGVAHALVSGAATVGPDQLSRAAEIRIDAVTVIFGLAAAFVVATAITMSSILESSRLTSRGALIDFSRSSTGSRRVTVTRRTLVVGQVAAAFVLLMGSAVLLASFLELLRVDPGYDVDGILTASTLPPSARYAGSPELQALVGRSLDALRALPGVTAAGASSAIPLQADLPAGIILPEGYAHAADDESPRSSTRVVATPGYFDAMRIDLITGRVFDDRDTATAPRVVVVDAGLAARFWPGQPAVGRRVVRASGPSGATAVSSDAMMVIGVVEDTRMRSLAETTEEGEAFYVPYAQAPTRSFTFAVRTDRDPTSLVPSLRAAISGVDPQLALFDVQTMAQRAAASLAERLAVLMLSLAFGVVSLLLASFGLYGLLSHLFTQRRREIAVRMAVGCTSGRALALFLKEGAAFAGAGIVLGALAAVSLRNVTASLAYGVTPLDLRIFGAVLLLLAAVAFPAIALPARRAARVSPAETLVHQ
jgi:predicted permease